MEESEAVTAKMDFRDAGTSLFSSVPAYGIMNTLTITNYNDADAGKRFMEAIYRKAHMPGKKKVNYGYSYWH